MTRTELNAKARAKRDEKRARGECFQCSAPAAIKPDGTPRTLCETHRLRNLKRVKDRAAKRRTALACPHCGGTGKRADSAQS